MSTPLRALTSVRTAFARFIDYAGLFPPALHEMEPAVREYGAARSGDYAWMLGRFILPASRLAEFDRVGGRDIERSVIVDASRDPREWFVSAQAAFGRLSSSSSIACLEVPLPPLASRRETYDATIGQVAMLAEKAGLRNRPTYVEIPRDARFAELLPAAMAALARYRLGAKLRCGGLVAEAFPSVEDVCAFIRAAADERVPFKATAGLHHPVRHFNAASGFTMHGFLNLLSAAVFARRVDEATLRAIVSDEEAPAFGFDESSMRWRDVRATGEEIAAAREHGFVAYGSCSFAEPVDDLVALQILPV